MSERANDQHRAARGTAAARTILPVLALAGVLAGCTVTPAGPGTASSTSVAAPAPTPTSAGASPTSTAAGEGAVGPTEQAVADALRAYQATVAANDFPGACGQMTVEAAKALMDAVQATGAVAPGCPEALGLVIAQPGAQEAAIEAANSIVVDDVVVAGFTATITWTTRRQGVERTDSARVQSVDGRWLLAGPA